MEGKVLWIPKVKTIDMLIDAHVKIDICFKNLKIILKQNTIFTMKESQTLKWSYIYLTVLDQMLMERCKAEEDMT